MRQALVVQMHRQYEGELKQTLNSRRALLVYRLSAIAKSYAALSVGACVQRAQQSHENCQSHANEHALEVHQKNWRQPETIQ